MVAIKTLIIILLFGLTYSFPYIFLEDRMRVKCDRLYDKFGKFFKEEYEIEYKLRRNWFLRFVLNKQEKLKWKKFIKFVYFNTEL